MSDEITYFSVTKKIGTVAEIKKLYKHPQSVLQMAHEFIGDPDATEFEVRKVKFPRTGNILRSVEDEE